MGKPLLLKMRQEVLQAALTPVKKRSVERLNSLSSVIKSFIAELGIEPSSPQYHLCMF